MIAVVKIAYRLGESSKILSAAFMFFVTSNAKQLLIFFLVNMKVEKVIKQLMK